MSDAYHFNKQFCTMVAFKDSQMYRLKKFVDYLNGVRGGALNLNLENVNQTAPES
jgi:hypothetical protein